ncbi:MAG: hypothetical protein R2867_27590 [Caldilineaceae bacterium]
MINFWRSRFSFLLGLRPRDYQITGIKFLAERKPLLGDEMGLGKTVQTIIALQILYRPVNSNER